jgi:NitT/TauT family transport system ATP-binding protein
MSDPILTVRNLSITFPDRHGSLDALEAVSFDVQGRAFVCVLGPSGSGKSTLLRILAGLIKPTSGSFAFAGATTQPTPGRQPKIGMVFQQSNLMPWRTALENITLPLEVQGFPPVECRARAQELIDLMGLQGCYDACVHRMVQIILLTHLLQAPQPARSGRYPAADGG